MIQKEKDGVVVIPIKGSVLYQVMRYSTNQPHGCQRIKQSLP